MLKILKRFLNDSALFKMKHFLIEEVDFLNKKIIETPFKADDLIKRRDEINHALFGV